MVMRTAISTKSLTSWHDEHCHFYKVCDIMNKAWVAGVYMTSWVKLFLLFIGKEWTNVALPWGAQTWSRKKYFCCRVIKMYFLLYSHSDRITMGNLQLEIFVYFLCFQASLHLLLRSPLSSKTVHNEGMILEEEKNSTLKTLLIQDLGGGGK